MMYLQLLFIIILLFVIITVIIIIIAQMNNQICMHIYKHLQCCKILILTKAKFNLIDLM